MFSFKTLFTNPNVNTPPLDEDYQKTEFVNKCIEEFKEALTIHPISLNFVKLLNLKMNFLNTDPSDQHKKNTINFIRLILLIKPETNEKKKMLEKIFSLLIYVYKKNYGTKTLDSMTGQLAKVTLDKKESRIYESEKQRLKDQLKTIIENDIKLFLDTNLNIFDLDSKNPALQSGNPEVSAIYRGISDLQSIIEGVSTGNSSNALEQLTTSKNTYLIDFNTPKPDNILNKFSMFNTQKYSEMLTLLSSPSYFCDIWDDLQFTNEDSVEINSERAQLGDYKTVLNKGDNKYELIFNVLNNIFIKIYNNSFKTLSIFHNTTESSNDITDAIDRDTMLFKAFLVKLIRMKKLEFERDYIEQYKSNTTYNTYLTIPSVIPYIISEIIENKIKEIFDNDNKYIFSYKLLEIIYINVKKNNKSINKDIDNNLIDKFLDKSSESAGRFNAVVEYYVYNNILTHISNNINNIKILNDSVYTQRINNFYNNLFKNKAPVLTFVKERNDAVLYSYRQNDLNPRYNIIEPYNSSTDINVELNKDTSLMNLKIDYFNFPHRIGFDSINESDQIYYDSKKTKDMFSAKNGIITEIVEGDTYYNYSHEKAKKFVGAVDNNKYIEHYNLGKINGYFRSTETSDDIAKSPNCGMVLLNKLRNGEDIIIIGNGQSGSGKTSVLINFIQTDKVTGEVIKEIPGILPTIAKALINPSTNTANDKTLYDNIKKTSMVCDYNNNNEELYFTKATCKMINLYVKLDDAIKSLDNFTKEHYFTSEIQLPNKDNQQPDIVTDLIFMPLVVSAEGEDVKKDWICQTEGKEGSTLANIIGEAFEIREVFPTKNNPNSSRSHIIVCVSFEVVVKNTETNEECIKTASMVVCDLAGVEDTFTCEFNELLILDKAYATGSDKYKCIINKQIEEEAKKKASYENFVFEPLCENVSDRDKNTKRENLTFDKFLCEEKYNQAKITPYNTLINRGVYTCLMYNMYTIYQQIIDPSNDFYKYNYINYNINQFKHLTIDTDTALKFKDIINKIMRDADLSYVYKEQDDLSSFKPRTLESFFNSKSKELMNTLYNGVVTSTTIDLRSKFIPDKITEILEGEIPNTISYKEVCSKLNTTKLPGIVSMNEDKTLDDQLIEIDNFMKGYYQLSESLTTDTQYITLNMRDLKSKLISEIEYSLVLPVVTMFTQMGGASTIGWTLPSDYDILNDNEIKKDEILKINDNQTLIDSIKSSYNKDEVAKATEIKKNIVIKQAEHRDKSSEYQSCMTEIAKLFEDITFFNEGSTWVASKNDNGIYVDRPWEHMYDSILWNYWLDVPMPNQPAGIIYRITLDQIKLKNKNPAGLEGRWNGPGTRPVNGILISDETVTRFKLTSAGRNFLEGEPEDIIKIKEFWKKFITINSKMNMGDFTTSGILNKNTDKDYLGGNKGIAILNNIRSNQKYVDNGILSHVYLQVFFNEKVNPLDLGSDILDKIYLNQEIVEDNNNHYKLEPMSNSMTIRDALNNDSIYPQSKIKKSINFPNDDLIKWIKHIFSNEVVVRLGYFLGVRVGIKLVADATDALTSTQATHDTEIAALNSTLIQYTSRLNSGLIVAKSNIKKIIENSLTHTINNYFLVLLRDLTTFKNNRELEIKNNLKIKIKDFIRINQLEYNCTIRRQEGFMINTALREMQQFISSLIMNNAKTQFNNDIINNNLVKLHNDSTDSDIVYKINNIYKFQIDKLSNYNNFNDILNYLIQIIPIVSSDINRYENELLKLITTIKKNIVKELKYIISLLIETDGDKKYGEKYYLDLPLLLFELCFADLIARVFNVGGDTYIDQSLNLDLIIDQFNVIDYIWFEKLISKITRTDDYNATYESMKNKYEELFITDKTVQSANLHRLLTDIFNAGGIYYDQSKSKKTNTSYNIEGEILTNTSTNKINILQPFFGFNFLFMYKNLLSKPNVNNKELYDFIFNGLRITHILSSDQKITATKENYEKFIIFNDVGAKTSSENNKKAHFNISSARNDCTNVFKDYKTIIDELIKLLKQKIKLMKQYKEKTKTKIKRKMPLVYNTPNYSSSDLSCKDNNSKYDFNFKDFYDYNTASSSLEILFNLMKTKPSSPQNSSTTKPTLGFGLNIEKSTIIIFTVINITPHPIIPVNNPPIPPFININKLKLIYKMLQNKYIADFFLRSESHMEGLNAELFSLFNKIIKYSQHFYKYIINYDFYKKLLSTGSIYNKIFVEAKRNFVQPLMLKQIIDLIDSNNAGTLIGTIEFEKFTQIRSANDIYYICDDKKNSILNQAHKIDLLNIDDEMSNDLEKSIEIENPNHINHIMKTHFSSS